MKKDCKWCDQEFSYTNKTAKFCGKTCNNRALKGVKIRTVSCKYCERNFTTAKKHQVYCFRCIESTPEHIRRRFIIKDRLSALANMAKSRAKKKELDYNLTSDYLVELWNDQEGSCALSGRKFELGKAEKFRQVHPDAPSVDRIVPSKGYTQGNIRFLTYHCNVCVNEYGDEALIKLMNDIINRRSGRR